MAAIDPSGFAMSIIVSNADGMRVPLWMANKASELGGLVADALGSLPGGGGGLGGAAGGDSSGSELLGMDLPIVEAVDVEISLGLVGRITVQVAAPFDLGQRLLESPLFLIGNKIEVQLGYPRLGRFTPWVSAIAEKPSIRMSGDEGLMVTMNGSGGGIASLRGTADDVFEGLSYKEIIKQIADKHGWATRFPGEGGGFDLESVLVGAGLAAEGPLEQTRNMVSQENKTDWFFIQKLVRASSCDAFLGPGDEDGKVTLFVQRRKENLEQSPRFKLLLRGNPDFETSFPMLDFSSEAEGVWLPGAALGVKSQDINPDTKGVDRVEVSATTSDEPVLGDAGVLTGADRKIDGTKSQLGRVDGDRAGEFLQLSCRDPRHVEQVAQAHRDEAGIRGGIMVNTSSYAIPEVLPGEVFQVEGAGVFNANYFLETLAWSASGSEWMARYTLRNNTVASGLADKVFLEKAPSTNTESADEGAFPSAGSGGGLIESAKEGAGT